MTNFGMHPPHRRSPTRDNLFNEFRQGAYAGHDAIHGGRVEYIGSLQLPKYEQRLTRISV